MATPGQNQGLEARSAPMSATPAAMARAGSHGTASSRPVSSSRLRSRIWVAMTARAAMSTGR